MSAVTDSLPIIGGILGPSGLIWAVIRYIVKQLEARATAAELRADNAETAEAAAHLAEGLQRQRANEADTKAARLEAANAGLTQRQVDMEAQQARDAATIGQLRGAS